MRFFLPKISNQKQRPSKIVKYSLFSSPIDALLIKHIVCIFRTAGRHSSEPEIPTTSRPRKVCYWEENILYKQRVQTSKSPSSNGFVANTPDDLLPGDRRDDLEGPWFGGAAMYWWSWLKIPIFQRFCCQYPLGWFAAPGQKGCSERTLLRKSPYWWSWLKVSNIFRLCRLSLINR